jgi:hypothetical protein
MWRRRVPWGELSLSVMLDEILPDDLRRSVKADRRLYTVINR